MVAVYCNRTQDQELQPTVNAKGLFYCVCNRWLFSYFREFSWLFGCVVCVWLLVCIALWQRMNFCSLNMRCIQHIVVSECVINCIFLIFMAAKNCDIFEHIKSFLTPFLTYCLQNWFPWNSTCLACFFLATTALDTCELDLQVMWPMLMLMMQNWCNIMWFVHLIYHSFIGLFAKNLVF